MSEFKYNSLFSVGDRVVFTHETDPDEEIVCGEQGIVSVIATYGDSLGITWDKRSDIRHDLEGKCDYGYGWWVPAQMVERVGCESSIEVSDSDLESLLGGGF